MKTNPAPSSIDLALIARAILLILVVGLAAQYLIKDEPTAREVVVADNNCACEQSNQTGGGSKLVGSIGLVGENERPF